MAESRLLIVATGLGWPSSLEARLVSFGLSHGNAAELAAFLADITATTGSLPLRSGIHAQVWPHGTDNEDPGTRLARIFHEGFATGVDSLCVIGTSAPHLPAAYILEAFGRLTQHRDSVVLGPTDTGGYYLIGTSRTAPYSLLKDIPWGTPNVLTETLQRAVINELSISLLPSLQVVETPEHGRRLSRDLRRGVVIAPQTQSILRNTGLE